jgi:hypothetical protein
VEVVQVGEAAVALDRVVRQSQRRPTSAKPRRAKIRAIDGEPVPST